MKRTFLIEKYKQILNNVIEKLSQTDNNKKPVGRPNKFDDNFYLKYIFMMRGKINVIAIIHFKKLLIYFLKNKLIFSILNTYETHFFNRKI